MKSHVLSILLALVFVGSGVALAGPNGAIDLFWVDPQTGQPSLTSCHGTTDFIPGIFGNIEISVQARLAGLTAAGVKGTEFYVEGLEVLPPRWRGSAQALGSLTFGNFIAPAQLPDGTIRRGTTAFVDCQPGTMGFVELCRIQVTGSGVTQDLPSDMHIRVIAGSPPGNPAFPCPLLNICDPTFTKICVTGGEFIINPQQQNCTVGLEPRTWSHIKGLYRD